MSETTGTTLRAAIKEPSNLSPRIQWLRDYYFQGLERPWNNEWTSWTTGTPWDFQYEEGPFYIVPETYTFFSTFRASFKQRPSRWRCPMAFGRGACPSGRPGL